MIPKIEQIRADLIQNYAPLNLELIDNSHSHRNHQAMQGANYEISHLKIRISKDNIEGKNRIDKHKNINNFLRKYFAEIHSIEIELI
ncbi:MAG: BolA/IbaG family iron-sulfur metabolism protein [Rickettsiales bacterium]|nr:BolA/IbaG family iron-sulfur metabolism protein [Rickettsiales bacterium]